DGLEVRQGFGVVDHGVGRGGQHDTIQPLSLGATGQRDRLSGANGGDAADDRYPTGRHLARQGEETEAFPGIESPGLTGVAGDDEAVDPFAQEELEVGREAGFVELT